ncbi:MAG: cobalamin-binding protein [Cyanobacteria bacterium QS_8_64_29]|nr:MAG: cobalamin-binding protein [Cyanobacteria bacterium QS_8_64_29]
MSQDLRIVSLLPAATETVAALGLSEALVGRSHECDFPPQVQSLPVCTRALLDGDQASSAIDADVRNLVESALSLYQVDAAALQRLQPTHVVTQDQCDACAVSLGEVQAALAEFTGNQPQIVTLRATTLSEVWRDIEALAGELGVDASPTLTDLQARVDACTQTIETLEPPDHPRVALLEWTDPLMAAGNWIPELARLAGARPALGTPGDRSPYLSWQALYQADPEVIVVMPCGFDLSRTRQAAQSLLQQPGWLQLQAVRNNAVCIADGNAYFNRPGPRLVDSLEILAEMLHPQSFDYGYQGRAWERLSMPVAIG